MKKMKLMRVVCVAVVLGSQLACGAGADTGEAAADAQQPLSKGAYGPEVLKTRQYLTKYGYFPNQELQARYPAWHPMLPTSEGDLARFDDGLESALKKFQQNYGLAVNGTLDAATSVAMDAGRCGVPDTDPTDKGRTDKWALTGGGFFGKTTIHYSWDPIPSGHIGGLSAAATLVAIGSGVTSWVNSTGLILSPVQPTDSWDFKISWGPIDGPGNIVGETTSASGLTIDTAEAWTSATLTQAIAHEVGHLLGLAHSSNFADGITAVPLMAAQARAPYGLQIDDDKIASNALYANWETLPGAAVDIGVGIYGTVWVIGTGDNRPYRWNGSGWDKFDFGLACKRVDVDSLGNAWVVTSSGAVYRYSGGWSALPGGGRLLDIGIGTSSDLVYGLGTNGQLFRYVGGIWQPLNSVTGSTSVDVDVKGNPWVVAANSNILQCNSNGCSAVPAGGAGEDVGFGGDANASGTANWAWAIGGSDTIWLLDSQAAKPSPSGDPGSATPGADGWVNTNGLARRISVGPHGRPWVVNSGGHILRRTNLAD